MKTFRRIQKIAAAVGLVYGFWISNQMEATGQDIRTGLLLVALSIVVLLGMVLPGKNPEQPTRRNIYGDRVSR
ncbi:hypothetical protein HF895_03720 [Bacteroides sp. AN502]|nr:hypothetical protein [Caecibacteroides pullorum]MDC6281164.1 hypothetical protein [Caecibacteroides pullorum]